MRPGGRPIDFLPLTGSGLRMAAEAGAGVGAASSTGSAMGAGDSGPVAL